MSHKSRHDSISYHIISYRYSFMIKLYAMTMTMVYGLWYDPLNQMIRLGSSSHSFMHDQSQPNLNESYLPYHYHTALSL